MSGTVNPKHLGEKCPTCGECLPMLFGNQCNYCNLKEIERLRSESESKGRQIKGLQVYRDQLLSEIESIMSAPPCRECGAMTEKEAEEKCTCSGDKDHCHGCEVWPE